MINKELQKPILGILEQIINYWPNENSRKILSEIWLCEEHIEEIFEILKSANARASLYKSWMKKNQFGWDLDDDIIFQKAVEIFMEMEEIQREEVVKVNIEELLEKLNDETRKDRDEILYDLNKNWYEKIQEVIEKTIFDKDENLVITALQEIKKKPEWSFLKKLIKLFQQTGNKNINSNLVSIFSENKITEIIPYSITKLELNNEEEITFNIIWLLWDLWKQTEIWILEKFKNENKELDFAIYTLWEKATISIHKINARKFIKKLEENNYELDEEMEKQIKDDDFRWEIYPLINQEKIKKYHSLIKKLFLEEKDFRISGRKAIDEDAFERIYVCAIFLYMIWDVEDIFIMYDVKHSNFDLACWFDLGYLLWAGYEETINYLENSTYEYSNSISYDLEDFIRELCGKPLDEWIDYKKYEYIWWN